MSSQDPDAGPTAPIQGTTRPALRRARLAGAAVLFAVVVVTVTACGSAPLSHHAGSHSAQPDGAGVTAGPGGLPASALGPDACKVPATSGSGPWKMVAPEHLCGLPYDKIVSSRSPIPGTS